MIWVQFSTYQIKTKFDTSQRCSFLHRTNVFFNTFSYEPSALSLGINIFLLPCTTFHGVNSCKLWSLDLQTMHPRSYKCTTHNKRSSTLYLQTTFQFYNFLHRYHASQRYTPNILTQHFIQINTKKHKRFLKLK